MAPHRLETERNVDRLLSANCGLNNTGLAQQPCP